MELYKYWRVWRGAIYACLDLVKVLLQHCKEEEEDLHTSYNNIKNIIFIIQTFLLQCLPPHINRDRTIIRINA